jgi:hypothetical protein
MTHLLVKPSLAARLLPDRYRRLVVLLFFGLLLGIGMQVSGSYGSFTDEDTCRESGQISMVYVYEFIPSAWLPARAAVRLATTQQGNRLPKYIDRDYGVAFELPMTLVEKLSGYSDKHDIVLLRHRCVFLVSFAGVIAFYWLATQRLANWRIGLLGAIVLILSPRQFADAFYNCKDGVFLSCYLIAMATAVAFLRRPSASTAAYHALACAVAIDVRIVGSLVPVLTVAVLFLRTMRGDYTGRRIGRATLLYTALLVSLVIAMWPYLWTAPVSHFCEGFANMSHFRWKGVILHQGRIFPEGAQLPWSYAAVWIGITTPLVYLAGLVLSFGLMLRQLEQQRWRLYATEGEWQDLLFWGLGLGPLVAVALLHSVLYDGWRQLYFVYPPLLLLALRGLVAMWRWQPPQVALRASWQVAVAGTISVSLALVAAQMAQLHPLENLYFNALAGAHPELRYEYDYWGLSFRQGLQWILRHDSRPHIRVQTNLSISGITNWFMLTPAEKAKLVIVPKTAEADYFMTTYRFHPQPYNLGQPVYSLRVEKEGRRVFDIFRLH